MAITINKAQAKNLIVNSNGGFFTVTFIKRTTGEVRTMNCTSNYKKLLKGGQAKYNALERDLVVVMDVAKHKKGESAIRSIPLDSLLKLSISNEEYLVTD